MFLFVLGKVKLGFHRESGFKVAIKIIAKNALQARPQVMQKLEREIAIMKFLDHPNVLRLFDVYDTPNYLFLVLEHVEGGELFDYLLSKGKLPEEEALKFFQQLVDGLSYCHVCVLVLFAFVICIHSFLKILGPLNLPSRLETREHTFGCEQRGEDL
jgi:serine/threonine protein kinase